MQDKNKLKEKLFGTVTLRPAPGGFTPTQEELLELNFANSVARVFCEGCGMAHEITAGWIELVKKEFPAISPPADMHGYYVHVKRCIWCDEKYRDVEFRAIEDSAYTHKASA